jgi:hypothetical protein
VEGQFPAGDDHVTGVSSRRHNRHNGICAAQPWRENIQRSEFTSRRFKGPKCPAKVSMPKPSDPWSIVVIALTIALFILALFVKGFTKGLLVECGVLLVSIKLILMAKRTAETEQNLERRLDRIEKLLSDQRVEKSS